MLLKTQRLPLFSVRADHLPERVFAVSGAAHHRSHHPALVRRVGGGVDVGDILDVCRNLRANATGRVGPACFEQKTVVPMDDVLTRRYIRMVVQDQPRVLSAISGVFGEWGINIESMVQKAIEGNQTHIVWVMHEAPGRNVKQALKQIADLPVVLEISKWLRVEE